MSAKIVATRSRRPMKPALKQITQPLKITIVLAPEDPRLADFDADILRKLRRTAAPTAGGVCIVECLQACLKNPRIIMARFGMK